LKKKCTYLKQLWKKNPIKLSTFIEHIEQLSNKKIAKRSMISHKTEPPITYCDNRKARKMLNFIPKTNIREGLEKTWNWFHQEYAADDDDGGDVQDEILSL